MKMHRISRKRIEQVIDLAMKYEHLRDKKAIEDQICQEIGIPSVYTRKVWKSKSSSVARLFTYKQLLHIIKVRKRWLCDIFNLPHWMNLDDVIAEIRRVKK